ncbi:hypothetical protein EVAR_10556_1 [Eumeta japonica]|uniref:Uncharacterized protein n=1 Tax=Eumeta variegata TaxID=151549 RepID=A0A4C1ZNH9_EUMVA|nr:hypothetical protein EVAR_10556_1 [Eumeta japonica]
MHASSHALQKCSEGVSNVIPVAYLRRRRSRRKYHRQRFHGWRSKAVLFTRVFQPRIENFGIIYYQRSSHSTTMRFSRKKNPRFLKVGQRTGPVTR